MNTTLESELPGAVSDVLPPVLSAATVLVPILNLGIAEGMIDLAATLAAGAAPMGEQGALQPRVIVLGVVAVPADEPLTSGLAMPRSSAQMILPADGIGLARLVPARRDFSGTDVRNEMDLVAERNGLDLRAHTALRPARLAEKSATPTRPPPPEPCRSR